MSTIDRLSINTIRMLGVDAINYANSGHPGIVLGAAPMAHRLYTKHLNIFPKQAKWFNRDRFVLSAGHGSMLVYALNHLAGFNITIDDIKNFRKPGNTAGHPEYGHTEGVETTSGPLGQGISNAVGMALAESHLAQKFNRHGYPIVDHYTYVICGDGDLQEGVAQESISLAGHLKLEKLIVLFDSNDIQLDGPTNFAISEDHKKRFEAVGWHYQIIKDGNDLEEISKAINRAKRAGKPSLIEVKTEIGFGSPVAGTSSAHGSPLGNDARAITAANLEYPYDPFIVEESVYEQYKNDVYVRGEKAYNKWIKLLEGYQKNFKEDYILLQQYLNNGVEVSLSQLPSYKINSEIATRNASGETLEILSKLLPQLIGGSADLTASTKARGLDGHFSAENRLGRNINFGVREHAMASILNGIVLHGGLKAFAGGFFVFSDYMKPAIRLSALMNIPAIYVFTHDSLMVGEDGPTHQPVEQLAMLRSIPNLTVLRPADANETVQAWLYAIKNSGPTVLVLTRQNIKTLSNFDNQFNKGAYILSPEKGKLDGVLLASGSEVSLAISVQEELEKENLFTRVVSMPSQEIFNNQEEDYKKKVLPDIKTAAIEMASPMPWYYYTKHVYGVNSFGLSAPKETVKQIFKFTKEDIVKWYKKL